MPVVPGWRCFAQPLRARQNVDAAGTGSQGQYAARVSARPLHRPGPAGPGYSTVVASGATDVLGFPYSRRKSAVFEGVLFGKLHALSIMSEKFNRIKVYIPVTGKVSTGDEYERLERYNRVVARRAGISAPAAA